MAGGKETPRQKMIGLMYLVLMALLAMNVSKSILLSFVVINDGLETTNEHFVVNNERTYTAFDKAKLNDEKKVGPYWDKAQKVKKYANEIEEYINELKREVITHVEKLPEGAPDSLFDLHNVSSLDNYDVPTHLMIGGEPTQLAEGPFTAHELRGKMEEYKKNLIELFSEHPEKNKSIIADIETGIQFASQMHAGVEEPWEIAQFYHLPLAAVITNLTKMQADIRNLEADVIKEFLGDVSADDFKFDKLEAKVIANTNYVFLGDTFKAEVLVAALSTTQDPVLEAGTDIDTTGGTVKIAEGGIMTDNISYKEGKGIFKLVPKTEGEVTWGGIIKIKKPDGTYQPFDFTSTFMAAKPALVVSPTAMNVFYRGLDNPIEVSVPGVPTDKLEISISNASKSGSHGKFTVKPGKGKECVVSVSAKINGKTQQFGKATFRCKNVPDPKPVFAGSSGGNVKKGKLTAAQGVIARMENFEFDLKFNVVSFVMSATVKGKVVEKPGKGAKLTGDMRTLLKALKPQQKVYIEKIKAKGPDGTVRDLGSISIKVI